MKARCNNPKSKAYSNYGGRGIKICPEWENNFLAFHEWSMQNGYSAGLSIDRIDVNAGYSPENCRWATLDTQVNNKTTNVFLEYAGQRMTLSQWADVTGIRYTTLHGRLKSGKTPEQILKGYTIETRKEE